MMKTQLLCLFFVLPHQLSLACVHLEFGTPSNSDQILCREGYAIGYNYSRRLADWAAYRLTPEIINGTADRQNGFRVDTSIPKLFRVPPASYLGSGYDRGHLAPSESLDLTEAINSETLLLSNMAPQLAGLNRGVWKGLENRERKWTIERGESYVYIGMLYEGKIKYIDKSVPIPSHFFKVIYSPTDGEAIAYLFPHERISTRDLDEYLVSINEIEVRSGLNILSNLDDREEERIESTAQERQW